MSFKIFSLQLLGKIKPVEVIEKKRKNLADDFNEYLQVEASEELEKYLELESRINAGEFKKKKAEIDALQFKGSKEYNQLQEYEKLKKSATVKKYFKVESSAELKRFEGMKNAEKLNEYDKLLEYIKEGQFAKERDEIKKQVFKGSVEEKHLIDFKKLDKSAGIKAYKELHNSELLRKHLEFAKSEKLSKLLQLRNASDLDKEKKSERKKLESDNEIKSYFKFEKSKKLKLYHETAASHDLKRYYELKEYVENDDFKNRSQFLKDKKKFEKSEAFQKQLRFKQLAADNDVKFYLKYEKSPLYKNYVNMIDSFDLKRYRELEVLIASDEFKQRKAYLEDKKKWEKTDEFAQLQEFEQMKKLPHLVKYFKYKGSDAFRFFTEWDVTFEDNFSRPELDTEKWETTGFLANKMLGDNYSLAGDLNAYTNGQNIKAGQKLAIEIKKEKKTGKVWNPAAGFVPTELEYTSGIVSSWNRFWQEDGLFEAKIKYNPVKQVVNSFFLSGEQNVPRVNLIEMGTKNRVGISTLNSSGKAEVNGADISNLKKDKWYIFAVEKQGTNFTWKINDTEIFAANTSELDSKLHLNASGLVVDEIPAAQLPTSFEIEWVKCYRKK